MIIINNKKKVKTVNKKLTILTLAFWCTFFLGSSVYADTPITLHSGENRIPITVNVIRPLDITFSSNSSSFGTVSAKDASGNPIDVSNIAINEGSTYTISEDGTTINFSTNESITATPNTPPAGKAINFKGWKIGSSSDPVTSGTGTVDSTTTSFEAVFEEVDAPVPGGGNEGSESSEGSEGFIGDTSSEDSSMKVPDTGLFTIFSSASDGKSFFIALACIIFIAEVAIVIYELKRYKKETPKIDFKENVPITELVTNLKQQQEDRDKTVKKVLISSTSTALTAIIIAVYTITALLPNYGKVPSAIKPLGATTSEENGISITINLNEDANVNKLVSRQINIPVDVAPYGFILSQYYEDKNTNLIDSANGKFLPLGNLNNYTAEDKNDITMKEPNTYCAGANYRVWAFECTAFSNSDVHLGEIDEIRYENYVSDFDLFIRLSNDFPVGEYKGAAILNVEPKSLYMQDVGYWGDSLTSGVQVKATDNRDNKEYYVARLADGNIWMTQNLDFDLNSSMTYTPSNTDIPSNWTPSISTYATGDTTWNSSAASPESYDPGNLCWNGVLDENWETTLDNGTTACIDGSNMNYHIGNYYNWTAVVAMNDSSSYTTQNQDVNQSICPAGWMLPKSGYTQTGSGSFLYLKDQLSLTSGTSGNIQNTPVFFTYGGYWGGGSYDVGSYGHYWSSVVRDSAFSYVLYFGVNGILSPRADFIRSRGFSVRCVAR